MNLTLRYCIEEDYPYNFGDFINPCVFSFFTKLKIIPQKCYDSSENQKIIGDSVLGIGSIIQHCNVNDIVYGTGMMNPDFKMRRKPKNIRSVRGPMTRSWLINNDVYCPNIYGDPVLLMPFIYRPKIDNPKKYRIGVIPHYIEHDRVNEMYNKRDDIVVVNIQNPNYSNLIDIVTSCDLIFSSSLHAIILSDAYNVPAYRAKFVVDFGNFEFQDYFASVHRTNHLYEINGTNDLCETANKVEKYVCKINIINMLKVFPFIDNEKYYEGVELLNKGFMSHIHKDENYILDTTNYSTKLIIKHYNKSAMCGYIGSSFFEECKGLLGINDSNFSHKSNLRDYFLSTYGKIPCAILFLYNIDPQIFAKIKSENLSTKLLVWCDDIHYFNDEQKNKNVFTYTNADYLLSKYSNFNEFYNICVDNKYINFHHTCSSIFERDEINADPIKKIFIYGSLEKRHYPIRHKYVEMMKLLHPDKIILKQHPGYHKSDHIAHDTACELYDCMFAFTSGAFPNFSVKEKTDSKFYLVSKFFEITGCGVLLICNDYGVREELNKFGFFENEHYINITESNFNDVMDFLFSPLNVDKINTIRKNAFDLTKKKYVTHNTCKKINSIIYDRV